MLLYFKDDEDKFGEVREDVEEDSDNDGVEADEEGTLSANVSHMLMYWYEGYLIL